jgi:type III secretion system YscD/HrpQ family protein
MQRFILRVLTGPNAGAEAVLGERTTIGSAETDDITIGDGALTPGHFTIEVKGNAIGLVVGDAPLSLKDEARAKGTYPVQSFDLIKFGATCCAIGPEGAAWPAFAPADLLPQAQPAAAPPAEAEPIDASPPDADAVMPEPLVAPVLTRRARPRWTGWAAGAVAVVVLLVAGVIWIETSESDATTQAGQQTAQQIIAAQGAKGVTIRTDGRHELIAEGFVVTTDQQRRLRQALQDGGIAVKNKVVSLEQQVSAARTIANAAGARLSVEGDAESGKIVVDGFVPEAAQLETIVRNLHRDIADLRPLETRVVTPETVRAEVADRLHVAGLDGQTALEVAGNVVRIRGSLGEDGRKTVARLADELNGRWQGMARVDNATTGASAPVPIATTVTVKASPAPAKFVIVVGGKDGFVRDDAGRRYGIGDKLANGEVIEEIRVEEIITSRDGVKYRYTFGGGR